MPKHPYMTPAEHRTVSRIIDRALADADHVVTIWNGGDEPEIRRSRNKREIMARMAQADMDAMVIRKNYPDGLRRYVGQIEFVYGNGADGPIHDYTDNQTIRIIVGEL